MTSQRPGMISVASMPWTMVCAGQREGQASAYDAFAQRCLPQELTLAVHKGSQPYARVHSQVTDGLHAMLGKQCMTLPKMLADTFQVRE